MRRRNTAGLIVVRGRVSKVKYSIATFSAGELKTYTGQTIAFAGPVFVVEGDHVALKGSWAKHPKHGPQLRVESMQYDLDLDTEGLANYLAKHPEIKGIGPVKANIIAWRYGENFERVLLGDDWREIAEAAKVPEETIEQLRRVWKKNYVFNAAITWLAAFDLTHHQVTSLIDKFGESAVGILKKDPYLLIHHLRRFGFKKVDRIALKMGIPKETESRVQAGILHCIHEAFDQGHCWVEFYELIERANLLLIMDVLESRALIERSLKSMLDVGILAAFYCSDKILVSIPSILEKERYLAEVFLGGFKKNPHAQLQPEAGIRVTGLIHSLNDLQNRALLTAMSHSITVISGPGGTGKTFTLAVIARAYTLQNLNVALAAPTGKAARRMEEMIGLPAKTIHRLLGFSGNTYTFNKETPLSADVIIIDEFSMVDVRLAFYLFQAIDLSRTAVILAGDHHQLPSVGPGNILCDLIQARLVPMVILKEVVRQAGVLLKNSTTILQGKVAGTSQRDSSGRKPWVVIDDLSSPIEIQHFLLEVFDKIVMTKLKYDPLRDVQVLTPTHKGPLGTRELNLKLQRLLQKKLWNVDVPLIHPGRRPRLFEHDRVINTRNDYNLGVMNGAVGIVTAVGRDGSLVVKFDGKLVEIEPDSDARRHLQLALAISIHKSQGSEYPCVIALIHKSHSFQHHRNLLYTAVTRAKECAIIIGDRWAIQNCAKRRLANLRETFLPFILEALVDRESTVSKISKISDYQKRSPRDGGHA